MPNENTVVILLATLNGDQFLPEQLLSYKAQQHSDWKLLVSDDGSTDNTLKLIEEFAKIVPQDVILQQGPRQGFWQNFVSLVDSTSVDGAFFAYSDQDDIWLNEKLSRAIAWLKQVPTDVPALYFTRTELILEDGSKAGFSPLFTRPPSFANALVQNIGGGNTMVFNRAARLVLAATPRHLPIISHDWWTYQVVTGVGGVAHYDPIPGLQYRQHDQNIVGSNAGVRAKLVRFWAFMNGRIVHWNDVNLALLDSLRHRLTPDNRAMLDRYAAARSAWFGKRLYLFWRSGVYRQSGVEDFGLLIGSVLNRL